MVQKDLERIGIPYETADGIADFHAAGRHSHITELLRNGTTLPEAKELARHSDINMTMKYAHIGIVDQAKAVAKLPAPGNGALHGRCISGGVGCHSPSSGGKVGEAEKSQNPCGDRGFGIKRRHLAKGGKVEAAGIEPASCDPLMSASTCVVRRLMSRETGSANKARLEPATTNLASAGVAWADASPNLQPAFGLLRRGFLGRG
jgi:hypothetical protein